MKDPRIRLSKLLNEPIGIYDQDWEWVVSDSDRFRDYLKLYKLKYLTDKERNMLMEMMLQCVNDIRVEFGLIPKFWLEVKDILNSDFHIHKKTIKYWASLNNFSCMLSDSWLISKEMRKVYWKNIANKASQRDAVNCAPAGKRYES